MYEAVQLDGLNNGFCMYLIRSHLPKFLLVVLFLKTFTGELFANGFSLLGQDAFAVARGDAFVATADNPSAIYYNPAGMTLLKGDNLRDGIYGIYADSSYKPLGGNTTFHTSDNLSEIPQLFYVHSMEKLPLSFGLGVYFPYGGKISWPEDTGFRPIAINASMDYATVNPAVAWRILPSLSIGVGVTVDYVEMKTLQGYPASLGAFNQNNSFYFSGSGWSVGYNAGIRWQPIKQLSFGATYRSSAWVTLNGDTHFGFPPAQPAASSSANLGLDFPWMVVFGTSYRPTTNWNLEVDANYTDWSTFGNFDLQQSTPGRILTPNLEGNFDWQPSWTFEFGVTRYLPKGWHASAGYAFDENSVPNGYYTPLAADMDRHFFSIGIGRDGKRFDFDVTYQFGYGPSRTVTGSQSTLQVERNNTASANGTYGFISNAIMVSGGIHF
jgi:long-chain fatty acid transport protein